MLLSSTLSEENCVLFGENVTKRNLTRKGVRVDRVSLIGKCCTPLPWCDIGRSVRRTALHLSEGPLHFTDFFQQQYLCKGQLRINMEPVCTSALVLSELDLTLMFPFLKPSLIPAAYLSFQPFKVAQHMLLMHHCFMKCHLLPANEIHSFAVTNYC